MFSLKSGIIKCSVERMTFFLFFVLDFTYKEFLFYGLNIHFVILFISMIPSLLLTRKYYRKEKIFFPLIDFPELYPCWNWTVQFYAEHIHSFSKKNYTQTIIRYELKSTFYNIGNRYQQTRFLINEYKDLNNVEVSLTLSC